MTDLPTAAEIAALPSPDDHSDEAELPKHVRDSFAAVDRACRAFLIKRDPNYAKACAEQRERNLRHGRKISQS